MARPRMPDAAADASSNPAREFLTGAGTLLRGLRYWRRIPGTMFLGLVPGLIAFVLLVLALVPLFLALSTISQAITPFAEGWSDTWRILVRIGAGAVVAAASLVLAWLAFTALALAIGDPFYQRIWSAVEKDLGHGDRSEGPSFLSSVAESLRLVLLGLLATALTLLVGLVPAVGGALSAVVGLGLTGWLLARDLTNRAFDGRDVPSGDRRLLRRRSKARTLGFGIATQLCFLVPFGALLAMPTAVAGSTELAHDLEQRAEGTA